MKGRTIVLDRLQNRLAAALIVDGELDDFLIDGDRPVPGTVYRARADRPIKGQGGMFVTTPDGPAFLRQVKGLSPGQPLLVMVSGYAEPGKAIPVTNRLLFKSRYAIATPGAPGINISRAIRDEDARDRLQLLAHALAEPGDGLILRSASETAEADAVSEDIEAMLTLARNIMSEGSGPPETLVDGDDPHLRAWRDWSDPAEVVTAAGGFSDLGVLDMLDRIRGPSVALPGGGHLWIEPTRALVAVDVNTGSDTSLAAGLKANMAMARALPRALRLRGLGGQITIDPAPMAKKDRRGLDSALRAAFRSDSEETAILGWTPLGHVELQRKRSRVPLSEVLK